MHRLICRVLGSILLCSQLAWADCHLQIALINQDHFPFEYLDEKGQLVGRHIDMITDVANELDCQVTFTRLPWTRIHRSLDQGLIDGAIFLGEPAQLNPNVWFNPDNLLSINASRLMTLTSNIVRFRGKLQNLKGLRLGVYRGFRYGLEFDEFNEVQKIEVDTLEQMIGMIRRDRLDGALVMQSTFLTFKQQGITDLWIQSLPITEIRVHLGFAKQRVSKEFSDRFGEAMMDYKNSIKLHRLIEKYGI